MRNGKKYVISDGEHEISVKALARAGRDTQLDAMRTWFLQHYHDPVECCPYESAEGGYQFIWGGPFNPKDELFTEFGELVPEGLIDELAIELSEIAHEWSGNPDDEMDDYEFAAITQSSQPQGDFEVSMITTERLLGLKAEPRQAEVLRQLLYVNVIAAIETYLAAVLIGRVSSDPKALRRFVKTYPAFRQIKVPLGDVLATAKKIKARVRTELLDTVWHRLSPIRHMFKDALGVDFPKDMKHLYLAVEIRHDIVHRRGQTTNGKVQKISPRDVGKLIKIARAFVKHLEDQLADESDKPPEL